jgi:hypothetical protein
VFNGLGAPVSVSLNGREATLAPGDSLVSRVRRGKDLTIEARSEAGSLVERFLAGAPREGSLVYSVAGAAPFVEWVARYGPGPVIPPEERVLGAPRILASRADFILTMPPGTLKVEGGGPATRLSLNPLHGVHPDMMLDAVQEPVRRRLVSVHARWESPDQPFLPLWLSLAVSLDREEAMGLLWDRLAERPGDLWTIRELILSLQGDERRDLCETLGEEAADLPDDPGAAYLNTLCVPSPAERAGLLPGLLERFPDYPFLTRAAGLQAFEEGDTAGALALLREAFAQEPRVMLADMDLLARLSRLEGRTQAEILAEIGPWSPATRRLAAAEGPEEPEPWASNRELSLRFLHLGRPVEALNAAPEPLRQDMILWAAASDGAPPAILEAWRDFFLPENLSAATAWCDWALAVRESADRAPSEAFILANSTDTGRSREAFRLILGRDWEGLKELARGLDPRYQGQLALAASLVWGDGAPDEARHMAKSYLYIGERPYLS